MSINPPVVLSFSGHDPSGGSGIQADIETLISHQCHPCSVVTALTEQDSDSVKTFIPQKPDDIVDQALTIVTDFQVKAIKIGLITCVETAAAIYSILIKYPHMPVILNLVLAGEVGANMLVAKYIMDNVLPCVTVLTLNSNDARSLTQQNDLVDCGTLLIENGCKFVLITGTQEQSKTVDNHLFQANDELEIFSWDRLRGKYYGSSCTLATAIAALIAQGLDPFTAITEAQDYTWNALESAYRVGHGQSMPNRLFWMEGK